MQNRVESKKAASVIFCLILAINAFLLLLFILYLGLQSRKALGSVQMDVLWFGIRCYHLDPHIILVNIFAALTYMVWQFPCIKNEIRAFAVMILFCCCFSQFSGVFLQADRR